MDTKSKKYKNYNNKTYTAMFWTCVISFLIAVGSFTAFGLIVSTFGSVYSYDPFALLFPSEYLNIPDYISGMTKGDFAELRSVVWVFLVAGVISSIVALASLIYTIIMTGEPDGEGGILTKKADCIWTELQIILVPVAFYLGGFVFLVSIFNAIDSFVYKKFGGYVSTFYYPILSGSHTKVTMLSWTGLSILVGLIAASIGLWAIISMIRKLKAGTFIKDSFFGLVLVGPIKRIYHGGTIMTKIVILALAICLLSATIFLAPVVFILVLVFAPRWVEKYNGIKKGIDEVKSGNLAYKIPVDPDGKGELDILARDINEISAASSIAVQNELKSQRVKTDLISNVSHDLKTPLTSMVTYIDLLKTEGLDSANAPKYLDILDQKTTRLRQLTEDLFEAAKASSGAMPVNMQTVDMLALLKQSMGEMESRISASSLNFIVSATKDKYYVNADGQLLWRVLENLLNNVLKYAPDGSRVYINLQEAKGLVIFEMKNVSKEMLNVNATELMERFTRGDEARSTEGSGLGLAIAKDLIKLMGGVFEIVIDGDLFKVQVILNKAEPVNSADAETASQQAASAGAAPTANSASVADDNSGASAAEVPSQEADASATTEDSAGAAPCEGDADTKSAEQDSTFAEAVRAAEAELTEPKPSADTDK